VTRNIPAPTAVNASGARTTAVASAWGMLQGVAGNYPSQNRSPFSNSSTAPVVSSLPAFRQPIASRS